MSIRTCFLSIWVGLVLWLPGQAQWRYVDVLAVGHDFFEIDALGNSYLVNSNVLSKYSSTGRLLYQYADPVYAPIDQLDVLNPLRLVVYSSALGKVVLLDPQLSPQGEVLYLEAFGVLSPSSVAASTAHWLWYYHPGELCWQAIDRQQRLVLSTRDLSLFDTPQDSPPEAVEHQGQLLTHVPGQGLAVFDRQGGLLRQYSFELNEPHQFQAQGSYVFLHQQDNLVRVDLATGHHQLWALPEPAKQVRWQADTLYLSTGQQLKRYVKQGHEVDLQPKSPHKDKP